MNSINDILNQTADDLFASKEPKQISDIQDEENTPVENQTIDLEALKTTIYQIKDQLDSVLRLVNKNLPNVGKINQDSTVLEGGETIIEGVFNGEKMVGADGKEYTIPANYASKSKLVEGDIMKLTITKNGSFIFKQIGPIERKRLVGELVANTDGSWQVLANNKTYKVLTASITFYKGKSGDEVVIILPQEGESEWAAIENVIRK